MSVRVTLLCAAAALVAIGGIYLLVQVKSSGAAPPSGGALADATARHARSAPATGSRPRRDDTGGLAQAERPVVPGGGRKSKLAAPAVVPPALAVNVKDESPAERPPAEADFEQAMSEANKLYDRQQFDDARTLALKLLEQQPTTVRMLRVVVSSSCILGDAEMAQKYWNELPEFDRGQMSTRCARFDIKFK